MIGPCFSFSEKHCFTASISYLALSIFDFDLSFLISRIIRLLIQPSLSILSPILSWKIDVQRQLSSQEIDELDFVPFVLRSRRFNHWDLYRSATPFELLALCTNLHRDASRWSCLNLNVVVHIEIGGIFRVQIVTYNNLTCNILRKRVAAKHVARRTCRMETTRSRCCWIKSNKHAPPSFNG